MNRILKFNAPDRWINHTLAIKKGVHVPLIVRPRLPGMPCHTKTVMLNNEPPERPFEVLCKLQQSGKWKYIGRLQ
jgi:hypothetical protein